MKSILVLLFVLLILEARAVAGVDTDIPQTNQVILSSGRWKPSVKETQKALAAIRVLDGGFWFWQIEYEPCTAKCLNFASNGYA